MIRVHHSSRLGTRPIFSKNAFLTKPTKDFFGAPTKTLAFFGPPTGAYKYAFCSIFQNLPDSQAEIFEKKQISQNLHFFLKFHENCCFFKPIFCENFEIAAVQKDANLVELEKCCQTHIFLQNFVLIQPRTSPPKICKILQKLANYCSNFANLGQGGPRGARRSSRPPRRARRPRRPGP